jgi:hypothetical protein
VDVLLSLSVAVLLSVAALLKTTLLKLKLPPTKLPAW